MTTKVPTGGEKSKGGAAKAEPGEFSEKPAAMVPSAAVGGALQKQRMTQIAKMAAAGGEATDRYAKEASPATAEEITLLDRDELDNLIGVPFVIVDKTVRPGDFGPYLSLTCILVQTDDVVVFNCGGMQQEDGTYSGIPGQLEPIGEITPDKPHRVPSGLRKSEYVNRHTNTPSVTYYLNYADEKASLFARIKGKTKKPRAGANGTQKA